MERLTRKQKGFVKDFAKTHDATKAVLKNYNTTKPSVAAVIANENLKKPKILNALEEALPDEMLMEIHREGLYATKPIYTKEGEVIAEDADFGVRHKYLDSAYKLKGKYAPEKSIVGHFEVETDEVIKGLTAHLNALHRGTGISSDGGTTRALDTEIQD